ncbi:MAG TPA: TonB-dependent receptor [Candidatus Acidoferrum sp.]|jgi:hypothetical protein|nr:TonB-dependent receptor [Candidatus Acidoferrum sp.]
MFTEIRPKKVAAGFIALVVFALNFLLLAKANAQMAGATLSGTITDQSGGVVPRAAISIKNIATGIARTSTSSAAGFYSTPNLLPGTYEVRATAQGFYAEMQTGIELTVGEAQVLNFMLRVGRMTQTVEVTTEAPAVQLASSSISAVVNSTTVRELPLNGRSWTELATLQPGVDAIQTQASFTSGADRGNRGFGAQLSISGARPQQNNYRLDGVSLNDYANGGPGSVTGGNLGVDAIQEFSVLTTNYSAEYGKTSGGVVNAITRSGTNTFHGSLYEFFRNSALDARNFFDVGKIPPFRQNQFGVAAGGPIRRDRTFIFGDFEAIRQAKGISVLQTVPSTAARGGTLCSAPDTTPACTPAQLPGGVDPSVQKYLQFWPLPNGGVKPGTNGDIGLFTFAGRQVISENFFTTRVDHRFSENDSLAGTYLFDRTPFTTPDSLNNVQLGDLTARQFYVLEETHTFNPHLFNSVRFGFNRELADANTTFSPINPAAADPSLGANPGRDAAQVSVSGIATFGGGLGGNSAYSYAWNSFQGYDDAFLTRGAHSLKFGVAVERMQENMLAKSSANGVFNFGSLSAFLTNQPARFTSGDVNTLSERGLRQTLFGVYIQDDWRWRPNLTVNLGLRYEMVTVPTEVQGKLSNLINITDPTPHLGSPFFSNPTLRNFEPRVGFAWDPFHNGKTAVRAGFGVFDSLPLVIEFAPLTRKAAPFYSIGTIKKLPPGSFFVGATPLLQDTDLTGSYIEQHPHRSYVMQWNVNVQRELAQNLTAFVGYVGSRGVHLPFMANDANFVIPTLTSAGYLWPSPIGSGTIINPNFGGGVRAMFYMSNSFYHALELGILKRMSHGLQLQTSFTWGKSIDNSSATVNGDQFSNSIASLFWVNQKLTRAVSDFNIGRTLVLNGIWQLPKINSLAKPLSWLVNDWELEAIFKVSDGVPFTATFGTDGDPVGLNSGDPWNFPNRLTGPGCNSLVNPGNPNNYIKSQCFAVPSAPSMAFWTANCDPQPFTDSDGNPVTVPYPQCFNLRGNAGRNILTGPGTLNLDFSMVKNIPVKRISESFRVQFRAEVFNILNHANFAVPVTPDNTDIFDSTGAPTGVAGLLTSTTTTAREVQFALKIIW